VATAAGARSWADAGTVPASATHSHAFRAGIVFVPLPQPVPNLHHFIISDQWVRVNVRGPSVEATLLVPRQPTHLELNPLESVLAEVKTEGWR